MNQENSLIDVLAGRSVMSHANPIRWYLDELFPSEHTTFFRRPSSALQIVYRYKGTRYVLERVGKDRVAVLGIYNPSKRPEGENRYGYNPIENPYVLEFEIQRELRKSAITRGYRWDSKTLEEQAKFAFVEAERNFKVKLGKNV